MFLLMKDVLFPCLKYNLNNYFNVNIKIMPDINKIKKSYGFKKGSYIKGFLIIDEKSDVRIIKRYHTYEYYIILTLIRIGKLSIDSVINYINSIPDKIIYSQYKNPYKCSIEKLNSDNVIKSKNNYHVFIKCKSERI